MLWRTWFNITRASRRPDVCPDVFCGFEASHTSRCLSGCLLWFRSVPISDAMRFVNQSTLRNNWLNIRDTILINRNIVDSYAMRCANIHTPYILIPLTQSLVFCCRHWPSAIKSSSDFRKFPLHLHHTIDSSLINPQSLWYSAIDCLLIRIVEPKLLAPTDPIPGIFLSSLVFCYQIFILF